MRLSLRLSILAISLLAPAIAAAADSGFYLGYDLGRAKASETPPFSAESVEGTVTSTPVTSELSSSGHRFIFGYGFDPYVGIEFADADLGSHALHTQMVSRPPGVSCGLLCENSYDNSPRETVRGWSLSVVGSYPLPYGFSVFARYGTFWEHLEYDAGVTGTNSPPFGNPDLPQDIHGTVNATTDTFGFGVRWSFAEHWALRASWDDYRGLNDITAQTFDVRFKSIGVEYRF